MVLAGKVLELGYPDIGMVIGEIYRSDLLVLQDVRQMLMVEPQGAVRQRSEAKIEIGVNRRRPWIVRYGFTGFHGWHDYHGLTGLSLGERESASYNSYGGTGLAMIGRTFQRKAHVFLPEIGATWLWVHRESFTTEATDENWDATYSTMNDHDVWGQANLHWQSLYRYKKIKIMPSASVGIHQLLTDGETEVRQSVDGAAPVVVEDQQDRTALALASAVVLRSRRTALTLAYDGEYSSDIEEHNFWLKFKLRF